MARYYDKQGEQKGATADSLTRTQGRIAGTDPQFAQQGKDIIAGMATPVEKILKVLDTGRVPIQRALLGKSTEEMVDTEGFLDNAGRFALDVFLTPSTYVGGVGLVGGAGRTAAKKALGKEVVEHLVQGGMKKELAAKTASKLTAGVASKGAKEELVPATISTIRSRIAKELPDFKPSAAAGGGLGLRNPINNKAIGQPLIPGAQTAKVLAKPSQAIANFAPIRAVLALPQGRKALLGGYESMVGHELLKQNMRNVGADVAMFGHGMRQVADTFGRKREDQDRMLRVLIDEEVAQSPAELEAIESFRGLTASAREMMVERGMDVGTIDNYFTLALSSEAKAAAGRGVPNIFGAPGMAPKRRQLSKDLSGTIEDMNKQVKELGLFPEFEGDLFDRDVYKTMMNYFTLVAHKTRSADYVSQLDEKGLFRESLGSLESGVDRDITRRAGFDSPQEALEAAARGVDDPRLAALGELDPDQLVQVKATAAQKLREKQLYTQTAAVRQKLGTQGKAWTSYATLTNPEKSPLLKHKHVILSAAKGVDPEADAAAHAALLAELKQNGYAPIETVGQAKEWGTEPSLLIPGMPREEGQRLMAKYGQEAILTDRGIIYADGSIDPFKPGIKLGDEAAKADAFTTMSAGGKPVHFSRETSGVRIPLEQLSPRLNKAGRPQPYSRAGLEKLDFQAGRAQEAVDAAIARGAGKTEMARLEARARKLSGDLAKEKGKLDNLNAGLDVKGEDIPLPKDPVASGLALAEWKKEWSQVTGSMLPALNGRYAPRWLADEIQTNFSNASNMDGYFKSLEKLWGVWRKSVTGPFPGFHVRNAIGGHFNNWIGGVRLPNYTHFEQILRGLAPDGQTWNLYGGRTTAQLREEMNNLGIGTPSSISQSQFGEFTEDYGALLGSGKNTLSRVGAKMQDIIGPVAAGVENRLRGAAYLHGLEKYGDPSTAADFMFVRHGDYQALSKGERRLRLAMPFYVWSKTNLPFQLNNLVESPGRYQKYARFLENMEGEAEEGTPENPANQAAIERGAFRSPFDPQRLVFPDLPLYDVNDVTPAGVLARMPVPAGIAQAATGKSLISGRDLRYRVPGVLEKPQVAVLKAIPGLEGYFKTAPGGETLVSERLLALAGIANPTGRVGSTVDQLANQGVYIDRDLPLADRVANFLGATTLVEDPQRNRNIAAGKQSDLIAQMFDMGFDEQFRATKEAS